MASRILVPLDGSSLAEQAISCAMTLARALPAELLLLRAFWIPTDVQGRLAEAAVDPQPILYQLETEADSYLSALTEGLRADGMSVRHYVRHGPAAETILEFADQAEANQIVMATHGYSGLKRWTHGSVAERVLQAARVPLLLVRVSERDPIGDRPPPMTCNRILIPLDGSQVAEQILPTVTTVAQALHPELILFQVPAAYVSGWMTGDWFLPTPSVLDTAEQDAEAYLSAVAARLQERGLNVVTATLIGPVANCIVDYAEANHVDLIAMCTHGRTGLARWALGSVADRVLRTGSTPILLVRAE
jgi:nucleotide-binding universal stress UspA family protein